MKVNLVLLALFGIILIIILINITSRSKLEPVLSKNIKTYQDLIKDYSSIPKTPGGIPKLIIKTSWQKLNKLSPEVEDVLNITLRLNPDYRVYYFDDDDCDNFMKSYGSKEYSAYNKLVPGAYKADLLRYCILYKYGGCYSDIGHVMLKSFDSIIEDNKLVIVKDKPYLNYTGIHNALMCVVPSDKFIKQLIDVSVENIKNNYYGENP
jgi:mannosyltransferase OCH1-like enzyme